MDILFSNITCVTMDAEMHVYPNAFVGVTGGKISHVGKAAPEEQPDKIIDGAGMVLMPGLINCHTHLPMTILRGYADGYPLNTWLNDYIFPREDRLDGRAVKAATLLGIAECLRFGTTSVSDMYSFCDEIAQAVDESGIKANISRGTLLFADEFDVETYPACVELMELHRKWHGYDNGRIKIDVSIHGEYTSDYRLWDALSEYAINNGLRMHLHLSETKQEHEGCIERSGLTPTQVLNCHRVFDAPAIAAHCCWLEDEDRRILAAHHATAVHNPVSNLKLAGGCADVPAMIKAGMNVALGTDGDSSNNNLDMFEEMKAAVLTANALHHDPGALPAPAALTMATVCGAKAQGREAECGQIRVGYDADLIMLNFAQPHLIPCHNVLSNLVYSARGSDVVMTMVRGNILYMNGEFTTIDTAAVLRELHEYAIPLVFSDDKGKD